MNRFEIIKKFEELHVPKDMYCLNGGLPNDALCIDFDGEMWEVYYSERGRKWNIRTFFSESEALECLYADVVRIATNMGLI